MNSKIHIALLRGINVGKAKRVAMADLRALVEELGFGNVRTLLNSGQVVFSAPPRTDTKKTASQLETSLLRKTGVNSKITVLRADEMDAAIMNNKLLEIAQDHSRLMLGVVRDLEHLKKLDAIAKQDWKPDAFAAYGRFVFLWCPGGMLESNLTVAVTRALGDAVTTRNWATILKIQALAQELI